MAFLRTLALVVMLPVAIVACDLEFICNQGNYVIKNPDTTSYTDVNGYYENGTACVSYAEGIDAETLLVSDCGLENIQVEFLEVDGTVGDTCTLSCVDGERSQGGYSLPINFVLQSQSILRAGSAHYYCSSGIVLVRNPRKEIYTNSIAYTAKNEECNTIHILDNEVIEINGCDADNGVVFVTGASSSLGFLIGRKTNLFLLDCGVPSPRIDNGGISLLARCLINVTA